MNEKLPSLGHLFLERVAQLTDAKSTNLAKTWDKMCLDAIDSVTL